MPRPPAEVTAAARGAVEQCAIPARRMGWEIERRVVRGVVMGPLVVAVVVVVAVIVGGWFVLGRGA